MKATHWSADSLSVGDSDSIFEEPDEAIEDLLDNWEEPDETGKWAPVKFSELPETITLRGFVPETATISRDAILIDLLNDLDERYRGVDLDSEETLPTSNMIEATDRFIEAILKEYHVSTLKEISAEEINVQEWIKKNRPDWLEEEKV